MGNTDSKATGSNSAGGSSLPTVSLSATSESAEISDRFLVSFPVELRQLKQLKHLTLARNTISRLDGISELLVLENLDLSNNSLVILPEELSRVSTLISLNVSFNQLSQFPPFLHNLKQLLVLNLSNNQIPLIVPEIGLSLTLTTLNLSTNRLIQLPKEIGKLNSLIKLILNNNKIKSLPIEIGQLKQLILLDLAENELQTLPTQIGQIKTLQKLYLDNNDFLELISEIGNLEQLKELNLRSNQLVDLPNSFHRLKKLVILDLEDNQWENENYQSQDIGKLLSFLQTKRDIVNKARKTTSKEYRRTISRQKVEEKKRTSVNNLFTEQGFHFVEFKKELYRVKGKKRILVRKVECSNQNVTQGDVFVLICEKKYYVFWGQGSSLRERLKGVHFAGLLSEERGATAEVIAVEPGKSRKEDVAEFWKELGGKPTSTQEEEDDEVAEAETILSTKLFKFTEGDGGRIDIQVWACEALFKRYLDSSSCAILDCGLDVYVWCGIYSSPNEKSWSMLKAEELITHRRSESKIEWVVDGMESVVFKEMFDDWVESSWDPEFKIRQQQEDEKEKMLALEAEKERKRMEKEERELLEQEEREEIEQQQQQSKLITQQQSPSTPQTPNSNISTPPLVTSPAITIEKSEREKAKEREKEKIREKLRQRDGSSKSLPITPTTTAQTSTAVVLPSIPKTSNLPTTSSLLPPINNNNNNVVKPLPTPTTTTTLPSIKPLPIPTTTTTTLPSIKPIETKTAETKSLPTIPNSATTTPTLPSIKPIETKTAETKPQQVSVSISKETPQIQSPTISNQQQQQSTVLIDQQTNLIAPLPDKVEGSKNRKAATKNPIRARLERAAQEEEAAKQRLKEQGTSTTVQPKITSKSTQQVGGFGLLYSLGADEEIFKQKREKREQQQQQGITSLINAQPKDQPKLLHIKGRRSPYVRQVELSYLSLNSGDVFILDCGKEKNLIYQWNGSESNRIEKGKGMDIAKSIKDKERVGCRVVILDEGKENDDFWNVMGGSGPIASASSAGDDREAELNIRKHINLYKVVLRENDELDLQPMEGRLSKTMLEGTECYILDCVSEMFVWTGSNSKLKIRNQSLKLGAEMLESRKDNVWVAHCHREFPGSEQVLFKERFPDWGGNLPIAMQQVPVGLNTATTKKQEKIDIQSILIAKPEKEEVMIDDGSSTRIQIWRIEEFTKVALDPKQYGQFYGSDSYLILYTYTYKNKDNYLIYFWQGKNSSINEKGTSALLTMELDDTLKGMAKEVRVVQNKEPKHFLSIFEGKLIVHQGKDPLSKGYKRASGSSSITNQEYSLYHIRGTTRYNTRAIQVKISPFALNSYNSYVLTNNSTVAYVWHGNLSNPLENKFARNLVNSIHTGSVDPIIASSPSPKVIEIQEGKESKEFWNAISASNTIVDKPITLHPFIKATSRIETRLFSCSIGSGVFVVEEVHSFAQDDLLVEDVYIIDGIDHIWVWIGTDTTEVERKMSMEVSIEYGTERAKQLGVDTIPSYITYAGKEPYIFTSLFHGWDFSRRKEKLTYDQEIILTSGVLELYTKKYSYDDIVNKRYPKGLDGSRLEEYLSDDEFQKILKMTLEDFKKLPLWRKQSLKKELQLY